MEAPERFPLVGRDREIAALSHALDELPSRGATVVIRGEPGLGKSRLVQEVLDEATSFGYSTAAGSSTELEKQRPFAALIEAFRGIDAEADTKELLTLLVGAGHERSDASFNLSYQAVENCLAHLDVRLSGGPLVLALEDLHWADASTLSFVRHAATRLMDRPLLLVATRRPWPREPQLDRIEEMRTVKTVALRPLKDEAVLALAQLSLGSPPGKALIERLRGAEGNPLFLHEVLTTNTGTHSPDDFARSVTRRLTYLSVACTEVLRLATILGERFRLRDLSTVTGKRSLDLTPVLEEALESGLLREDGDRLRFTHELVRDAIYRELPATFRQELHLEVANKLADAGVPPVEVAPHFLLGAQRGDATAVEWIWRAGRQSAPRSPATAVDLLTHALDLADEGFEQRDMLAADLISSLLWSGDFRRAERRAEELIDRPSTPEARAGVRYALARVLAYRGRVAQSLAHVDAALAEPGLTDAQRARLLADASLRSLVLADVSRSRVASTEAIDRAERLRETSPLSLALCAGSRVADHRGYVDEAIALARRSASLATIHPSDAIQFVQPALYLGLVLISGDSASEAVTVLERGRRDAESVGAAWSLPLFHLAAALARFHTGSWDDALADAKAGLALSDETETQVWAPWTRALIARIQLHRDDVTAAEEELRAARSQQAQAGCTQFGQYWIDWTEALLREARGDRDAAAAILQAEWDRWPADEPVGDHRETAADMVRLALANDDRNRAVNTTRAVEEAAARWSSPSSEAMLLACRGLLAADAGPLADAGHRFETSGRILPAAQCLERAAELDSERSGDLRAEALRMYESVGATRDATRMEHALRGPRRIRPGRPRRPSYGWESLTETEVKVVNLVAEGLTNRQIGERLFVSHRTVDTHVSHALAKLGASTRSELAVVATRRSL